MDNRTIKFIYAIKDGSFHRDTLKEEVAAWMSHYTGTPESHYTPSIIYSITKEMFLDFLSTADNPSFEVRQFFDYKNLFSLLPPKDDTDAMLITMQLAKVRRRTYDNAGYVYINGFRDVD